VAAAANFFLVVASRHNDCKGSTAVVTPEISVFTAEVSFTF
jgi:hypothetical protein